MGRLDGKVVMITGAARGQGRSHAIRVAEEGADVIAIDICAPLPTVEYGAATPEDLDVTAKEVEARGRRVFTRVADVRDFEAVKSAAEDGVAAMGQLDVVVANAGMLSHGRGHEISSETWQTNLDVNLTGVWHTTKATTPILLDQGSGGSIILVSSVLGLIAVENAAHYVAAKHGVTGLTRALALELGHHSIRVNSIHPGNTLTPMLDNELHYRLFRPDLENPVLADAGEVMAKMNILPDPWMDPVATSHAVVFLASDESRFITGVALPVDAGMSHKPPTG